MSFFKPIDEDSYRRACRICEKCTTDGFEFICTRSGYLYAHKKQGGGYIDLGVTTWELPSDDAAAKEKMETQLAISLLCENQ